MSSALPIPFSVLRDKLVHIVDADLYTCESLSVFLRLEGFQTAFSNETSQFFSSANRRLPDIIILNFAIDGGDGLSVLKQCRSLFRGVPIIMLTDAPNMNAAVEAMKLGACDIIAKPINSEWLLTLIRDVFRKDVHFEAVVDGQRHVEVRGFAQLTPREREVLQMITNGLSNKSSARELGISPRTIEVHRARVMEKLGAKNTAELMRIVLTS